MVFTAIFDNLSDIVNWEHAILLSRVKFKGNRSVSAVDSLRTTERPPAALVEGHCAPYVGCNVSLEQVDPAS